MNFDWLGLCVERLANWVHFVVVDSKNVKEFNFFVFRVYKARDNHKWTCKLINANILVTRNLISRQKSSEWIPMFIKFEGGRSKRYHSPRMHWKAAKQQLPIQYIEVLREKMLCWACTIQIINKPCSRNSENLKSAERKLRMQVKWFCLD